MAKGIEQVPTEQTIKRFLRRHDSPAYFKEGGWTDNPEEAKSFADVVEMAETCARLGLSDVELALRAQPGGSDLFCTPLR